MSQGGGLVVEEEDLYQPVLSLRIAIVGFRNLPDVHTTTTSTTTSAAAPASTGHTYKQSIASDSRSGREEGGKSVPIEDTETRASSGTRAGVVGAGGRSGSDSSSESLQRDEKEGDSGGVSSGGYASGGRKKTTTRPPFVRVVYLPMADDELKLSLSDEDDQVHEAEDATKSDVDGIDVEEDICDKMSPGDDESEGETEEERDDGGRNRTVSSSSGTSGGRTSSGSGMATHQHTSPRSPQSSTQTERRQRSSKNKKRSSPIGVGTGSKSGLVRGRRGLNLAARREFLVGCVGLHSNSGSAADAAGLGSASAGTGTY